jgi:alcohol dehydrogenase class IV
MDYNLPVIAGKLVRIAAAMGEPTWMLSQIDAAKLAVQAVAELMDDVGLPLTLQEYGAWKKATSRTWLKR